MHDLKTNALVFSLEERGEHDYMSNLFTETHGMLQVRIPGARKPKAKLSPHVGVGDEVRVRLIFQKRITLGDAVLITRARLPFDVPGRIEKLLSHGVPDPVLWRICTAESFSWPDVLSCLGWNVSHATCEECGRPPAVFLWGSQFFACDSCAVRLHPMSYVSLN